MKKLATLLALVFTLVCLSPTQSFAAANTANILVLSTTSTNVTTSAYVAITAAGGTPIPISQILFVNNTSSTIKIAYGASGSETDYAAVGPTDQLLIPITSVSFVPVGTRLAVKAVDTTASSGYLAVSLIP
jgi:hypothetical protein